jgi:hypothetical protein
MRTAVVCSSLIAVSILMDDIRFVELPVSFFMRCGDSPSDGSWTSLVPAQGMRSTGDALRSGPLHPKASDCQIL